MENDRKNSRGNEERYDLEILLRRPSLRTNIPRRISQICPPTEETYCGVGYLRGKWLQSFANRHTYVFIYGVLGSFYGSYYAYFYGAVSSLEKRFKISSRTIGLISSTGDLTMAIMCFILSFCVPKNHQPKVIGIGIVLIIASTIVFALPHFLTRPKNMEISSGNCYSCVKNETNSRQCQGQKCSDEKNSHILLFISQILHGIGGSLYFTAGKSYKDDNIERHQPPALLSLLRVLMILGPGFGYWLSSMFLKVFEYPDLMTHITEEEPQWIGAWWIGSLVIGFMLIIPGFLVSLFPQTLPKAVFRKYQSEIKGVADHRQNLSEIRGFKRLFFSPAFDSTHFTTVFNIMGFMAYFIFLPKYVETQYRVPASKANLIVGSITLISSAAGVVTANSVITRYCLSARILASWTVIASILSVGGLISYNYLGCQAYDDEALAMVARNSNSTCQCANTPYFPVCDERRKSFTSPCHAGCENIYINFMQGYEICNPTQPSLPRKVYKGFCPSDSHSEFLKFIITTYSISFIYATGRTSNYWFKTNYKNQEKLLVLSSGMSFVGLLITIPAPIIFGSLLDESCILWDGKCDKVGNCWLYDNGKLRLSMNFGAVGYAIIGVIYDLSVWYFAKNLELFDHFLPDETYDK